MSSSDAVYEVEKILDARVTKNRKHYLIRWKGYDSSNDTWEPEENLSQCYEALSEFLSSRNSDSNRCRKKTTKTEYRRRYEGSYEYVDPRTLRPKDSFWDDLESGKVDVFATDMYSRAKRVNGNQSARAANEALLHRASERPADRWWTMDATSESDAEGNVTHRLSGESLSPVVKKKGNWRHHSDKSCVVTQTTVPFVGIRSETLKRASAAMAAGSSAAALADQEIESGELTDSEDEGGAGSLEGRRRSKKKKHRHDKDYHAKRQRKKERKEKEHRKRDRRERREEDGAGSGSALAPAVAGPSFDPKRDDGAGSPPFLKHGGKISHVPAPTAVPTPSSVPRPSSPNPATLRLPQKPAIAGGETTNSQTLPSPFLPLPPAPSPATNNDLSDDEMSEADLCIVEETGECVSDNADMLVIVDEIGEYQDDEKMELKDQEETEIPGQSKNESKDLLGALPTATSTTTSAALPSNPTSVTTRPPGENGTSPVPLKVPPLTVRLPVVPKPSATVPPEKASLADSRPASVKKRRNCDPMWDELDAFPVIHSLKELEEVHKEKMKSLSVKRSIDEIIEFVKNGDTWALKLALEHESCPRLDNVEQPLVYLAAQRGFDDVLELLLSKKADVNKPNENGTTALMIAAEGSFITTTSILLTCGAYMNTVNSKGETAMIRAVKHGSSKTVKCLLDHGCNFNAMVSENRHALAWARQMKLVELDLLLTNFENYIGKQIEEKAKQSLDSFGEIVERILPVHVLSFWEAEEFHFWFASQVYAVKPGEGNLLFLANAVFQDGEMRCQLRGDCFVEKVVLNDVVQQSVTKTGQFVLSFSPLHDGENKCTIFTKPVPYPSLRFVVAAFRVKLKPR